MNNLIKRKKEIWVAWKIFKATWFGRHRHTNWGIYLSLLRDLGTEEDKFKSYWCQTERRQSVHFKHPRQFLVIIIFVIQYINWLNLCSEHVVTYIVCSTVNVFVIWQ